MGRSFVRQLHVHSHLQLRQKEHQKGTLRYVFFPLLTFSSISPLQSQSSMFKSVCVSMPTRGGSNTFNLLGIPNTFKYLYLTSNTKYFQSICIWPQILNTQSCQILFQILVKYFFEKKSIISFQKRANLPPFF